MILGLVSLEKDQAWLHLVFWCTYMTIDQSMTRVNAMRYAGFPPYPIFFPHVELSTAHYKLVNLFRLLKLGCLVAQVFTSYRSDCKKPYYRKEPTLGFRFYSKFYTRPEGSTSPDGSFSRDMYSVSALNMIHSLSLFLLKIWSFSPEYWR